MLPFCVPSEEDLQIIIFGINFTFAHFFVYRTTKKRVKLSCAHDVLKALCVEF